MATGQESLQRIPCGQVVKEMTIKVQIIFEKQEYLLLPGGSPKDASHQLRMTFKRVPHGRVL